MPLSSVGRRLASAQGESEPTMRGPLALRIVLWIMLSCACAADALSSQDAAKHIGETATVCGTVVSTNYASRTKRLPTFLNFDQPYPPWSRFALKVVSAPLESIRSKCWHIGKSGP